MDTLKIKHRGSKRPFLAVGEAVGAEAVEAIHEEHRALYGTRVAGVREGGNVKCLHAFTALHLAGARTPSRNGRSGGWEAVPGRRVLHERPGGGAGGVTVILAVRLAARVGA